MQAFRVHCVRGQKRPFPSARPAARPVRVPARTGSTQRCPPGRGLLGSRSRIRPGFSSSDRIPRPKLTWLGCECGPRHTVRTRGQGASRVPGSPGWPPDLLIPSGTYGSIDLDWEDPMVASMYHRLASFSRLIRGLRAGHGRGRPGRAPRPPGRATQSSASCPRISPPGFATVWTFA